MSRLGAYVSLFAALYGCGYTSSYVAPIDGRARVIWNSSDSEATVSLGGGSLGQACQSAIRQLTGHERMPLERSFVPLPSLPSATPYQVTSIGNEYYVPRYYGPDIIVVHPGVLPHLPHPPLFVPRLVRPGFPVARLSSPVGGGTRVGSIGGSSSGSSGDAGKGLAILAVVAIVVMPVISITLASVRPESERQASQAIDAVNAYNDMLRGGGSPCEPDAIGGSP